MAYVDGFVLVIQKKNVGAYVKMAKLGAKMWKKYGALEYFECIGDDLKPNMGGTRTATFPKMVKLKKGETVWFSFIVFKSRAHRNSVNAKVMKDPAMKSDAWKDKPIPFDMKRLAVGGFRAVVKN